MSHSIKTQGIVIGGINFGEADKILTVITDRLGKIKVIAKGVRKIKSHMAGSLEPYMEVDLQLQEGRNFYIVTGVSILKDFSQIHTDLKKTSRAFYFGELVDKFSSENEKNEELYDLLVKSLRLLEERDSAILIKIFELKIISLSGFKPELYSCVHCKSKLIAGGNYWDAIEGGIICNNCQAIHHHGKEISDSAIKLFRVITEREIADVALNLRAGTSLLFETEELLSKYIEHILERELKSSNFLKLIGREYSAD